MNPASLGWLFVFLGVLLVGVGLIWVGGFSVPWLPLGRLPGDIVIEGEHSRFYFPITTSILVSLLLSGILWTVRFFASR
jgi:hypothetical protein